MYSCTESVNVRIQTGTKKKWIIPLILEKQIHIALASQFHNDVLLSLDSSSRGLEFPTKTLEFCFCFELEDSHFMTSHHCL